MKRREALIMIANQLDFLNNKFEGARKDFDKEELKRADIILTTLEHAGMLPPASKTEVLYHPEAGSREVWTEYDWEPEND